MARFWTGWRTPVVVLSCTILTVILLPEVSSTRFVVGGANRGWTRNVNYIQWDQGNHFYVGDWLFFVYDRERMNVLEVNKRDYKMCNNKNPIRNWTTGAGRDVVPLNVARRYYFINGKSSCRGGTEVAVCVRKPPPPRSASLRQWKIYLHKLKC